MEIFRQLYDRLDYDALIVLAPANTFYLSGYASSNCAIVLTRRHSYFVTDTRYAEEARKMLNGAFEVTVADADEYRQLSELALIDGAEKIGWDDTISYREYRALSNALARLNCESVPIGDEIACFRDVKNTEEIDKIVKAQAITERAFDEILKFIEEGVSEIEVAARLEYAMLNEGAQIAFDSIVAFGDHGSVPHAHRGERRLRRGEFVTMDFGAKYQGYCSDMTRTVALGYVSDRQADIYDAVLRAQKCALDGIKAGIRGCEGDALARAYLTQRGYGEYFTHSLGHGLGVEIHEGTGMTPRTQAFLKSGMVVSVEPGVYVPGECGVRIEDIVVVRDDGVSNLTKSNKNLIIL